MLGAVFYGCMAIGACLVFDQVLAGQRGLSAGENIKNGAQLYDNWLKITESQTAGNHPLYPTEAAKKGKSTWRCKECHGWDYMGKNGRYSKGSHYTGITGVMHVKAWKPEQIHEALTNTGGGHDFSRYLSEDGVRSLVVFLHEGLAGIENVIDSSGRGRGDVQRGEALYDEHCAACHGPDGNMIDFKSARTGVQGVRWLAEGNPQETIHKIRWGHPGSEMPSMVADAGLSEQECIDILTYSQSLAGR